MQFNRNIYNYCDDNSSKLDGLYKELERETNLKTLAPQMLSGALQGKILRAISKMIRPTSILEIGTFTGYATLCLAEGLKTEGSITTIEINAELNYISQKYFKASPFADQIKPILGNALEILPELKEKFDLIFIDAGKKDNEAYYKFSLELLNPGGYILVDNVLWDGKVIAENPDLSTAQIIKFNEKIKSDARVENVILPIRDGINLIRKL